MAKQDKINVGAGDMVTFTGFSSEDIPESGELLEEGAQYEVESLNEPEDGNDESINLKVPNPEYDNSKRRSKKNPEFIMVDVFADEFTGLKDEEGEEGEEYDTILFADVKKGDKVSVLDTEGETLGGTVFKKTKTLLGLVIQEDDGEESEAVYKVKEIEAIYPAEAEAKEEPEPKPKKATKKAATKKKATKKAATKKKAAKKPAKSEDRTEDDEDLKGILLLEESEEDEDVIAMVEETSDICELAYEMAEEAAVQDYRLGGIIYHVRISKAFREVADGVYNVKGGFQEYVEAELGIGYRKAMYLIEIYTKWSRFGLDASKVAEIGWTKAQEIARVMTADNAEQLVELAEGETVADLKETIKESYGKKGTDTREVVKKVTFKFRLTEDAGSAVENYIEMATEQLGLKKAEEVFEHIVTEWAQEHLDVSKVRGGKKTATKKKTAAKKRGK